jgi:lipase chaperone LimK
MQSVLLLTALHIAACIPGAQEERILPQQSYTEDSRTLQLTSQGLGGPCLRDTA